MVERGKIFKQTFLVIKSLIQIQLLKMPEFIGFQTLVILDLYEAYFHAVTILSH